MPEPNLSASDEQAYNQMRLLCEEAMQAAYGAYDPKARRLGIGTACTGGKDPSGSIVVSKHGNGVKAVFACGHCGEQDEQHPVGMAIIPPGYYLCMDCLKLLERCKLKLDQELKLTCELCILEEAMRIQKINPGLVRDLRKG